MNPENSTGKRYFYGPYAGFELRSLRRLKSDLGVNQASAESILHLRNQVIELQSRLHELEMELNAEAASQHLRLARYRGIYAEATWIELEIQE